MTNSRKPIILSSSRILTCGRILISVLTVFVLTVFVNAQDTVFRYAAGSTESNASGTDITTVQKTDGAASGDVLKLSDDATQNGRLNLESNNAYLNFTIQSDTPGTIRTIKKTAGSDRFYNFNAASGTNASITLKDLSIQGSDSEITNAIGLFFHSSTSSTTVNLTVDNVTFSGFKNGGHYGGVIGMDNAGTLTITGSGTGKIEFNNNYAKTYGGAIHGANTTITGNVIKFTNNTAKTELGGAIYIYNETQGVLTITGNGENPSIEFSGNTAGKNGGAIYSAKSVTFSGDNTSAVFTGNTAAAGNDLYLNGSGTVLSFTDSGTYSFDGGIYVNNSSAQTTINKAQVTIAGRVNDTTNNYQLQTVNISNGGKLTANIDYIDSLTGKVNLGDAGSTGSIELNAGQGVSKTLSSFTISGAGALTKTGAGALTLSGANTYTGATTVSAGTLTFSSSALPVSAMTATGGTLVLGTAGNAITAPGGTQIKAEGGAVRVDGILTVTSGSVTAKGDWTGNGAIKVNGGDFRVSTSFSYAKGITLNGGILRNANVGGNNNSNSTITAPINVTADSTLKAGWYSDVTIIGELTGNGKLVVDNDSGWVVMETTCDDNSFTGGVQVNWTINTSDKITQGLLRLAADHPFGDSAGTANIYGTLDMNGKSQKFKGLVSNTKTQSGTTYYKGEILNADTNDKSTLTLDISGQTYTYYGTIAKNIDLVISGENGTQQFYQAPKAVSTTINSGTLELLNNGTLNNLSGAGTGTVKFGSKNLTLYNSSNTTFSGSLVGSGTLTFTNNEENAWIVMDTNGDSFSGNVQIYYASSSKQGRVKLGRDNAFGTNAGQANLYGTLDMNGYSQTFKGLYSDADKGPVCNSGQTLSTLTINTTGKDLTFQSSIQDNIALVITGTGTQTLKKAPEYTGSTTIESGTLVLSNGGELFNLSGGSLDSNGQIAVAATLDASGKALTLSNDQMTKFIGSIKADSIVKTGDGTLQIYAAAEGLVNASSFVVSSGRLDMKEYFKGSLTVESGATLSPGNSVGTLTVDGQFSLDSGATLLLEVGGPSVDDSDQLIVTNGNLIFGEGATILLDFVNGMSPNAEFAVVIDAPNSDESWLKYVDASYFTDLSYAQTGGRWVLSGHVDANAVPEPSTWALLVLGVAFWSATACRRFHNQRRR